MMGGKSVLSVGATVLKYMTEGKNASKSANNAFLEVGMSLLDDTVSSANGKKLSTWGSEWKSKKQRWARNIFS